MKTVVTKAPGQGPKVEEIEGDLESMQRLVHPKRETGALIQRVWDPGLEWMGVDLYCNEEGLFFEDCVPQRVGDVILRGPVFFIGFNDEGESISLTDDQVDFLVEALTL